MWIQTCWRLYWTHVTPHTLPLLQSIRNMWSWEHVARLSAMTQPQRKKPSAPSLHPLFLLSSLAFIPAPTKSHCFVLHKASASAGGTGEKTGSSVLQCPVPVWPEEASHIHRGQSQRSYVSCLETVRQGQRSPLVFQGLHTQPGLYQQRARCSERVKSWDLTVSF